MSVSTMKKITVITDKKDTDFLLKKLMDLRCVEVRSDTLSKEGLQTFSDSSDKLRVSEQHLLEIQEVLPTLYKYTARKKGLGRIVHKVNLKEFENSGRADKAYQTVLKTKEILKEIDGYQKSNVLKQETITTLLPWQALDFQLDEKTTEKSKVIFTRISAKLPFSEVKDAFENLGCVVDVIENDEVNLYLTLTYLKSAEKEVNELLSHYEASQISLPVVSQTPLHYSKTLNAEIQQTEALIVQKEEELMHLSDNLDDVEILADMENTNIVLCKQKQKLYTLGNCIVLAGWVPANCEETVLKTLSKFNCVCEISEPEEGEEPPVLLKNNKFAREFEWVIGMYSYPKYGTYDPTFIMSIFYFIIFGMMFADVGYGLLLCLACFGGIKLLNPKPGLRRMMGMFGICGISCIIMGVLFGGWFGDLPTAIMTNFFKIENPEETAIGAFFANGVLLNPINATMSFLTLSLALGEFHLVAGMFINMIEQFKKRQILQGIGSTIPYYILFAGIDMMAPSFLYDMVLMDKHSFLKDLMESAGKETFTALSQKGVYVFAIGLVSILLLKGLGEKSFKGWIVKGLGGLYAIISYASDLLSYSRILALGLVAGVISQVINMLTALGSKNIIGFFVMLIVLVAGHLLNLAINLLGTFVHTARLQYIEFFGKFYEDGGTAFEPLCPIEDHTEQISETQITENKINN